MDRINNYGRKVVFDKQMSDKSIQRENGKFHAFSTVLGQTVAIIELDNGSVVTCPITSMRFLNEAGTEKKSE